MSEQTDTIALLEERVGALIDALQSARAESERLRKRSAELEAAGKDFKSMADQNKKLVAQVGKLEGELRALNEKENIVQERLQGILEKIDRMEDALANQAAAE